MNTAADFKVTPFTNVDLAFLLNLLFSEPAPSERAV